MTQAELIKVDEGADECCWLCRETKVNQEISWFWECYLTHHARIFEGKNAFAKCRNFLR